MGEPHYFSGSLIPLRGGPIQWQRHHNWYCEDTHHYIPIISTPCPTARVPTSASRIFHPPALICPLPSAFRAFGVGLRFLSSQSESSGLAVPHPIRSHVGPTDLPLPALLTPSSVLTAVADGMGDGLDGAMVVAMGISRGFVSYIQVCIDSLSPVFFCRAPRL
jgi:hypothetical protein